MRSLRRRLTTAFFRSTTTRDRGRPRGGARLVPGAPPPAANRRPSGMAAPRAALDFSALSFPSLTAPRRKALAALRTMSRSVTASTPRWGSGRPSDSRSNATVPSRARRPCPRSSATPACSTTPSMSGSFSSDAREFLGRSVVVHSTLFGLIGADDPVPAYRFSHDTRLPNSSVARIWREANAGVLASCPIQRVRRGSTSDRPYMFSNKTPIHIP